MKYLFLILLFGSTILFPVSLQSQNNPRFRIHDRIVTAKLREIKANLKLDQATYDQFYPLYLRIKEIMYGFKDFGITIVSGL